MRKLQTIFAVILLHQQCTSLPLEESVVSVYTTHPTTMGTNPPLDVYHQIANNLAERITSPIYRFLGINSTKQETTTKTWDSIELLDDSDNAKKHDIKPVDNEIAPARDVEELSVEALRKSDKKPEKITLYSSYLPVLAKASNNQNNDAETNDAKVNDAKNDTWNELDDPFEWDEKEKETPKSMEQPLIYVLELFGSFIQLIWGGISALFNTSSSSSSGTTR